MRLIPAGMVAAFALFVLAPASHAADYMLAIKDHRFQPAELTVPADEPIVLTIDNRDDTPEEFESHDLRVEKIVTGGGRITVRLEPLPAGEYAFFGEFHEDTAQGTLIVE